MSPCSPSKFLSRWPGSLRPVVLPDPPPAIPHDAQHLLTEFGLPRELKIYCYNDTIFRFSGSATPLLEIWERDLKQGYKLGDMPSQWTRFWHLADQEYTQGGGWLCIEELTGRLVVIDPDLPDPVYLLNSSVRSFYTTLAHLLDWCEKTDGRLVETAALRDALLRQDCIPTEELEPFWMNTIDATLDHGSARLAVSLGPRNA